MQIKNENFRLMHRLQQTKQSKDMIPNIKKCREHTMKAEYYRQMRSKYFKFCIVSLHVCSMRIMQLCYLPFKFYWTIQRYYVHFQLKIKTHFSPNFQGLRRRELQAECIQKIIPPLITLLNSEQEIQYIALRNIRLVIQRYPDILRRNVQVFKLFITNFF